MSNIARLPSAETKSKDDDRVGRLADAVWTILEHLPALERDQVLRRVMDRLRAIPTPRAGDVLTALVLTFPERRQWRVDELREKFEQEGIPATAKELANALSYLVRRGHLKRVGYAQYTLAGGGITFEDQPDGTVRESEHYR